MRASVLAACALAVSSAPAQAPTETHTACRDFVERVDVFCVEAPLHGGHGAILMTCYTPRGETFAVVRTPGGPV